MRRKLSVMRLSGWLAGLALMAVSPRALPAATTLDDTAASVTFSSGWTILNDAKCYGGACRYSDQPNATAEITFSGPACVIYSLRSAKTGSFQVSIDGQPDATIDTRNHFPVVDYQCPVYQVNGLADGPHTLRVTTGDSGRVVLDAFQSGEGIPFVPRKVMLPTLPVGSIHMGGWIQAQMQEDMDHGWATSTAWQDGYPDKPYYYPLILRQGSRWGGEYPSHWISAVARFGWLADSPQYRAQATKAVRAILDSLEPDGYLGCLPPDKRWTNSKGGFFTMWSYGEGLNGLLEYYQYTQDQSLLAAVKKAYDLMEAHADSAYSGRCYEISCANAATALYQALGDRHYLERAQYWIKRYLNGYTSAPGAGEITLDPHSAGSGIIQSALVDYFAATFDVAAYYNILRSNQYLFNARMQVHGGAAIDGVYELGASWAENFVPASPYAASEACSLYYWTYLWMRMLSVSGESKWADYAERVLFNAVPAQRSKDGVCTAYGARPNESATHEDSEWGEDAEQYKKDIYTACCPSCLPRTYPLLNKYAVLRTQDEGLAVAFYGPGEATAKLGDAAITLKQETQYPFEERIKLTVVATPSRSFPLYLRMPAWCEQPTVEVNGTPIAKLRPGQWAVIDRTWGAADVVALHFPMSIKLHRWQDRAVAVERGPLVYTLSLPYRPMPTDEHGGFKPVLDDGTIYIDDLDSSIRYSEGFKPYPNHLTAAHRANESFEYTFEGTSVAWVSHRFSDQGTADVYLDGEKDASVNLQHPTEVKRAQVYAKQGLSPGRHTIKVVTTNDGWVCNDGFVVNTGRANPLSTWAYCLQLNHDDPAASFQLVKQPVSNDAGVWKQSPVKLRVRARRMSNWADGDKALPDRPWVLDGPEETIELVPIGFSTLRMTYLPYE